MRSELITDRHLARCAVIYVRQSSPHQVLTNQESLRLQYDLRRRALGLGWRDEDVEVIDADLGLSGAAANHREGFKDLILRAGLVREVGGVVVKNPDREVQSRLELIFATFLRVRSANKVLRVLNERGLSIPRRGRFGDTVWRSPNVPAILAVLKNPAYA